jgi:hypothetical protein
MTTDLRIRKAWQEAHWDIPRAFPGKRDAMLGTYYSRTAYVPKSSQKTDASVVVYKTEWPGYSVRSGSCTHHAWEGWIDDKCVSYTDTLREAIAAVALKLSEKEI